MSSNPGSSAALPNPPFSSQHAHRDDAKCSSDCAQYGSGYQVFPAEWPQDAAALQAAIDEIRDELTVLRGRVDNLRRIANDMDAERSLSDARGTIQGAIVMLWGDRERWRQTKQMRRIIDEHLPKSAVSV